MPNIHNQELEKKLRVLYKCDSMEFVENCEEQNQTYPAKIYSKSADNFKKVLALLTELNIPEEDLIKSNFGYNCNYLQAIIKTEKSLEKIKAAIHRKCKEEAISHYSISNIHFFLFTNRSAQDFGDCLSSSRVYNFDSKRANKRREESIELGYTLKDIANCFNINENKLLGFAPNVLTEVVLMTTDMSSAEEIKNSICQQLKELFPNKRYADLITSGGFFKKEIPLVTISHSAVKGLMRAIDHYYEQQQEKISSRKLSF